MYRDHPALGLVLHSFADGPNAFPIWVSGSWLVYDDGRVGPLSNLGKRQMEQSLLGSPSQSGLKGPIRATSSPDGKFIVMTANDAVLGADLSTPRAQSIDVKVVPEPQVQILSVATTGTDAGLFGGYVLTVNRVWALTAQDEQRWSVTQLDVPAGDWREVWSDHDRGRIGYATGAVRSLPSGVLLGLGFGSVRDFAQYCGRTYALTEESLFRLDPNPSSPVGDWAPQDAGLPPGKRWAKLFPGPATGGMWVFADDGSGVELKGAPCNP
jgi:hypothetical protein